MHAILPQSNSILSKHQRILGNWWGGAGDRSLGFPLPGHAADTYCLGSPPALLPFLKSRGAQPPSCAACSLGARVHAASKGTAKNKARGGESWAGCSTGFSTATVLTLNEETIFQNNSDVLVAGSLTLNLSQLTGQKPFFSLTSIYARSTKVCFKTEMFLWSTSYPLWTRYANNRYSMLYYSIPLAFYFLCPGETTHRQGQVQLSLTFRSYPFFQQRWLKHPHCVPSLDYQSTREDDNWKGSMCIPGDVSAMGVTPFGGLGITEGCHLFPKSFLTFPRHHYCSILMSSQRHTSHQLTAQSCYRLLLHPCHPCHCIKRVSRSWTVLFINYLVNVQW